MKKRFTRSKTFRRNLSNGRLTKKSTKRFLGSLRSKGLPVNHRIQTSNGVLAPSSTDSQNWAIVDGVNAPDPLAECYLDVVGNFNSGNAVGMPVEAQLLRMFNMKQEYEIYARPTVGAVDPEEALPTGLMTDVTVYRLTARHDVPKSAHYPDIEGLINFGFAAQYEDTDTLADAALIINNPATTPYHNTLLCQHFKIKQIVKTTLQGRKFSFKLKDSFPAYTFDKDWRSTDDYIAYEGSHFYLVRYHGSLAMGSGATDSVLARTGWPHYQPCGGLGFMRKASYDWVVDTRSVKMIYYEDDVVLPTANDNYLARTFQPQQIMQLSHKVQA